MPENKHRAKRIIQKRNFIKRLGIRGVDYEDLDPEGLIFTDIEVIKQTAEFLRSRGVCDPDLAIVLGSGLNQYADRFENAIEIPYQDIPGFAAPTVAGHFGRLIYGTYRGKKVVVLAGRFHFYEGHKVSRVVFPYRVLIYMGIKRLIITNASGCINENCNPGEFMLISDHINYTGQNPLIGAYFEGFGPKFPDMSDTYDADLREALKARMEELGIHLHEGVYVGLTGPSFETPAEIRFFRHIGGDMVGMSTVAEAIVANHAGLEVIGISLLSNMAAGIIPKSKITSSEVDEIGSQVVDTFSAIIDEAITIEA